MIQPFLLICLLTAVDRGPLPANELAASRDTVDVSEVVDDFSGSQGDLQWFAVNDNVMGGVSVGGHKTTADDTLLFSGSLSLANNGGFSSIRTRGAAFDLSRYSEIVVRLRGDGRRYALSIDTDFRIFAGGYFQEFDTLDGVWQEIRLPIRSFEARAFGNPLSAAPPINAADIRSIGFIIADKNEGVFSLEIDSIKAVSAPTFATRNESPLDSNHCASVRNLIETAISKGVPLFNAGQPSACAAVYEVTARSIVALSQENLPAAVPQRLQQGLNDLDDADNAVQRAWLLRHALDEAFVTLTKAEAKLSSAVDSDR